MARHDVRLVQPELVGMSLDPGAVAFVRERRAAEDVANRGEVVGRGGAERHAAQRAARSSASRYAFVNRVWNRREARPAARASGSTVFEKETILATTSPSPRAT